MKISRLLTSCLLAAATFSVPAALPAWSQDAVSPDTGRDGRHDFDFHVGTWATHIKRRVHQLSGSNEMVELTGIVTVRKIWDGSAQLEEIAADAPGTHFEGMALFLYNPQSRQWSQAFASKSGGTLGLALVGSFKDGRGELYSQDTANGRAILVRGTWSNITADGYRYEEAYSDDGGRTWEVEFSANLTRKS